MDIIKKLAQELAIKEEQAKAAVQLIDEGNTIPFIARYRKEMTGALNDETLRNLHERLLYLRNLEEKKEQVINAITDQGKMTEDLKKKILSAETLVAVDDLYRPYRPKKQTRATKAKEKGLEPLANILLLQKTTKSMEEEAAAFVNAEKGVANAKEAIAGAKDIIAEMIADMADYRKSIRNCTMKQGSLVVKAKDEKAESVYEMYYDFREPLSKVTGYRVLAINRGEKEKFLTVKVEAPDMQIVNALNKTMVKDNLNTKALMEEAILDAYNRLIAPSIERDIRSEITEKAQEGAITVFGKNLTQLLMQPPMEGRTVLGWDPAFRTGCKLAVVDPTGKVLDTVVVYPTAPQCKVEQAKKTVHDMIKKYNVSVISVGNGTACRESEQVITELIREIPEKVAYVIVNEAGASVYSASKLATEEFPEFDVGQRSAASIARRLQDPLAELVKIEPKAIGVGQYQHDMNQKRLEEALNGVVEDCVNKVGVDLNTASASLLEYISGISKAIAKNIVVFREENGKFKNRRQLLKVPKLGPKAFEQCAGFMRILDGDNALDATSVHPESYDAANALLDKLGMTMDDVKKMQSEAQKKTTTKKPVKKEKKKEFKAVNTNTAFGAAFAKAFGNKELSFEQAADTGDEAKASLGIMKKVKDKKKMAAELGVGEITLTDILKELEKPARDPREEMPKPILRTDVLEMKDLKEGMILKGTVRNVIDFGAFVDIGVHQDGLVHISQLSDKKFVKHPLEVVSVGDVVDVKVMSVDLQKQRIQLTMKL